MARNRQTAHPAPHGMLYGQPIFAEGTVSLLDQVYDILRGLIQQGKWELGERLPGITTLSNEANVSRSTVQRAFDRLAEEGYILQRDRQGSFLRARYLSDQSQGSVGLVISRGLERGNLTAPDKYSLEQQHAFHEEAARRGYSVETLYLDPMESFSVARHQRRGFSDGILGIFLMSGMTSHDQWHGGPLGPDEKPIINFSTKAYPCVSSNTYFGVYQLSRRVIAAGHRRIAVFCDPAYPVPIPPEVERVHQGTLEDNILTPHRRAMREAGLEVYEESIEWSRQLPYSSLASTREFLERFADASCILALRGSPPNVKAIADMLGRRVPEDLSIVSASARFAMDPAHPERLFSGYRYPWEKIAAKGFDILEEFLRRGDCETLELLIRPEFIEGHSLAPAPDFDSAPARISSSAPAGARA